MDKTLDSFFETTISSGALKPVREDMLLPARIIVSNNEIVPQMPAMKCLGYNPILIPAFVPAGRRWLADTCEDIEGYVPKALHYGEANGKCKKVRSLRKAWRDLLEDIDAHKDALSEKEKKANGVLICERRAMPTIGSPMLYKNLQSVFEKHPDVAVVRLFEKHTTVRWDGVANTMQSAKAAADNKAELQLKDLPAGECRTRLSPLCDGTYALFVNLDKLKEVSELFNTCRMPVDTALEFAAATGRLKVLTQVGGNSFVRLDLGDEYLAKDRTYNFVLSSYGRPVQVITQAMLLDNQIRSMRLLYGEFVKLTVVLRGYDNATAVRVRDYLETFLPGAIEGYCDILVAPNKTQLVNFLDSCDSSTFCIKVDDDDVYSPKFVSSTVRYLTHIPEYCCSTVSGPSGSVMVSFREHEQERSVVRGDVTGTCENTSAFSKQAREYLSTVLNSAMVIDRPKANDSIPMRACTDSVIGFNRYEYWRQRTTTPGALSEAFSVLAYEGDRHATGKSAYGAFAATAGPNAIEYGVRISDFVDLRKPQSVRPGMDVHRGLDAVIVFRKEGDKTAMYIPTNPTMSTPETGAAQPVEDVVIEDNAVVSFKFTYSGRQFVYEPLSEQFVAKSVKDLWQRNCKTKQPCAQWFRANCRDVLSGKIR